jgi:hypothetical protein
MGDVVQSSVGIILHRVAWCFLSCDKERIRAW